MHSSSNIVKELDGLFNTWKPLKPLKCTNIEITDMMSISTAACEQQTA
jgi:hypothetical protein